MIRQAHMGLCKLPEKEKKTHPHWTRVKTDDGSFSHTTSKPETTLSIHHQEKRQAHCSSKII